MNSRTSTNNGKKKPINNSGVKKKSSNSSTSTPPKKKNINGKEKTNANPKKTVTKEPLKQHNVNKKNDNQSKQVGNISKEKKSVTKKAKRKIEAEDTLDFVDVEGFEEYNNPSKKKVVRKRQVEKVPKIEEEEYSRLFSPLTIVTFSFIVAILIAGGYLMFNLEYFNLANISVVGNTKYTSEKIIENTSLKSGNNVFKELFINDYNKYEIPYVSELKYSYKFPNEIVINVNERYPEYVAKDKNSQKCYMLDNQGYILEECTIETKGDTLLLEGIAFEEKVEYGKQLDEVYIRKLQKYKEIKELLKEAEISTNITKVNFNASLTTITIDDKLNVVFSNDSNLRYRVSFLKSIINQNGTFEEGTIDMSLENPVYSKYD